MQTQRVLFQSLSQGFSNVKRWRHPMEDRGVGFMRKNKRQQQVWEIHAQFLEKKKKKKNDWKINDSSRSDLRLKSCRLKSANRMNLPCCPVSNIPSLTSDFSQESNCSCFCWLKSASLIHLNLWFSLIGWKTSLNSWKARVIYLLPGNHVDSYFVVQDR